MLTGSSYYDGTARVPGVGSAWQQVTKFVTGSNTEAVYCFPPTKTIMSQSIIFAAKNTVGATSSAVPEVVLNEPTFGTGLIFSACVKGAASGSFTQWTSLFPFGSGSVSTKYAQWFRLSLMSNSGSKITIYESKEALAGVITSTVKDSGGIVLMGAIIDPEQNVTATDAELDGRIYGIATGGVPTTTGAPIQGNFLTDIDGFLSHSSRVAAAATPYARFVTFIPQTGSSIPTTVIKSVSGAGSQGAIIEHRPEATTYSGNIFRKPLYCVVSSSFYFLGRLRDMSAITPRALNTVLKDRSNNTLGYVLGKSETQATASLLLHYS
jgi:hypothetical protein